MVHRIQLQMQTSVPDPFGQPQRTWTTAITTWAAIDSVRGLDVIRSGQETKQSFWTITMRWQSGVLPDMRIVAEDGEMWIIQSIENPLKRNILLVLNCLSLNETSR
jgi:SPP1 family predicted phage head-tail adaptor